MGRIYRWMDVHGRHDWYHSCFDSNLNPFSYDLFPSYPSMDHSECQLVVHNEQPQLGLGADALTTGYGFSTWWKCATDSDGGYGEHIGDFNFQVYDCELDPEFCVDDVRRLLRGRN